MSHLVRICGESEGQEQRLVKLIHPKRGVGIHITSNSDGAAPRRTRWKRADADSLCNLDIAKFTCEEKTGDADRFTCTTAFLHGHYDFGWRRKNGTTYIERFKRNSGRLTRAYFVRERATCNPVDRKHSKQSSSASFRSFSPAVADP